MIKSNKKVLVIHGYGDWPDEGCNLESTAFLVDTNFDFIQYKTLFTERMQNERRIWFTKRKRLNNRYRNLFEAELINQLSQAKGIELIQIEEI